MRELRTCPVAGHTVLLNDGWVDTPSPPEPERPCWYCAPRGPVLAQADGVCVVPHPVPALGIEGEAHVVAEPAGLRRDAVGAHELVWGPHDGPDAPLLRMVQARVHELRRDRRLRAFRPVRRHRRGQHVAWQLLALPFDLPPAPVARWRDEELDRGVRVVARTGAAVAICPWAPRVPFEVWVMPVTGEEEFSAANLDGVAALLAELLRRVDEALLAPPVDVVVEDGAPWRLVLRPRLGAPNAVSVATELPMHGVFPEAAARFLRG